MHEWISRTGGSEKVLDAMVEALPGADVLTLWNDDSAKRYSDTRVQETWLANVPLRRHKALALPFMPVIWRRRPGGENYDWALVSSHLFAHHISFKNQASGFPKYVYAHTPARYIWEPSLDRRGRGLLPTIINPGLQRLDRRRAQEAVSIAANSHYVRDRVRDAWNRDASVIFPPVDVRKIQKVRSWENHLSAQDEEIFRTLPSSFLLGASRFISYKRLDIVISSGEATNTPVVIAGAGPLRAALASRGLQARVPVMILDRPSDALLYALYQRAIAYVFPAIEDFGIMPVEAMAAGGVVIAMAAGGTLDTVRPGVSGIHCDFSSISNIRSSVTAADRLDRRESANYARQFSRERFQDEITDWMKTPHSAKPLRKPRR